MLNSSFFMYLRRDSNPQGIIPPDPKSGAVTYFATEVKCGFLIGSKIHENHTLLFISEGISNLQPLVLNVNDVSVNIKPTYIFFAEAEGFEPPRQLLTDLMVFKTILFTNLSILPKFNFLWAQVKLRNFLVYNERCLRSAAPYNIFIHPSCCTLLRGVRTSFTLISNIFVCCFYT